jgi:hypothetical protein
MHLQTYPEPLYNHPAAFRHPALTDGVIRRGKMFRETLRRKMEQWTEESARPSPWGQLERPEDLVDDPLTQQVYTCLGVIHFAAFLFDTLIYSITP